MTTSDPNSAVQLGEDPRHRPLLVEGAGEDFGSVTQAVAGISEQPVQQTNKAWVAAFMVSLTLLAMLGAMLFHLITTGVGVWGNNNPVYWG